MTWERNFIGGKIGLSGSRILLREVTVDDGMLISYWRNTPEAQKWFFGQTVVTPGSHRDFINHSDMYNPIWIGELLQSNQPIGMAGLKVNPYARTAEHGQILVSPSSSGKGYAREIEYIVLTIAFEVFQLRELWGEVLVGNDPVLKLHETTGFKRVGIDIHGHESYRGRVVFITYDRETWAEKRLEFRRDFGVQLEEWTP